jgi:hypothetical protein
LAKRDEAYRLENEAARFIIDAEIANMSQESGEH